MSWTPVCCHGDGFHSLYQSSAHGPRFGWESTAQSTTQRLGPCLVGPSAITQASRAALRRDHRTRPLFLASGYSLFHSSDD